MIYHDRLGTKTDKKENSKRRAFCAQNPGTDPASLAGRSVFIYYRLLLELLVTEPHMDYHAGSLEYPPQVVLTNATETFRITEPDVEQHLPRMFAAMHLVPGITTPLDLDWQAFRPLNELLGHTETYGTIWLPTAPDDPLLQSWLPHGMYRHHGGAEKRLFGTFYIQTVISSRHRLGTKHRKS